MIRARYIGLPSLVDLRKYSVALELSFDYCYDDNNWFKAPDPWMGCRGA